MTCDAKNCRNKIIPCIEGEINGNGEIVESLCKKHEKMWHDTYKKYGHKEAQKRVFGD